MYLFTYLTLETVSLITSYLGFTHITGHPHGVSHHNYTMLSFRGARSAGMLDIPWRYAPTQSYDKDTNPDGLISFAMAENVCYPQFLKTK